MPKPSILDAGKSYTFRSYFEMSHEPDEILAEFGVTLQRKNLALPQATDGWNRDAIAQLKQNIQRRLPYVSLTSEAARREILIAPIVLALIDHTQAQLRIEYALNVSEQLKGNLDYYLHNNRTLLVIEAKQADIARGFTQLAVELIALDRWSDSDEPTFYGIISTGDIWQFGCLHRQNQRVEQDLNLYRVPADLDELFGYLTAILQGLP
ncbi:MAG: hypothetical protein AAGD25_27310 [Cyanobacteria bacterium P01_F01_bin.150]